MKTLIFEGAGMEGTKRNDVDNCRIRTRIKNDKGRIIYLEMGGCETSKYSPRWTAHLKVAGRVDHLFYDDKPEDSRKNYSAQLAKLYPVAFEYTKENILKFVNEKLGCSFGDMLVDSTLSVHETKEALC